MAFPATLDTFTNPVGTNTLNSPDHASQHATLNNLMGTIESMLGTSSGGTAIYPLKGTRLALNSMTIKALGVSFTAGTATTEQEVTGMRGTLPVVSGTCVVAVEWIGYVVSAAGNNTFRIRMGTDTSYLSNTEYQNAYVSGAGTRETFAMQALGTFNLSAPTFVVISVQNDNTPANVSLSASSNRTAYRVSTYEPL